PCARFLGTWLRVVGTLRGSCGVSSVLIGLLVASRECATEGNALCCPESRPRGERSRPAGPTSSRAPRRQARGDPGSRLLARGVRWACGKTRPFRPPPRETNLPNAVDRARPQN